MNIKENIPRPEQFYNSFVDKLEPKPDNATMCLCLNMLRQYSDLIYTHTEDNFIKFIFQQKLDEMFQAHSSKFEVIEQDYHRLRYNTLGESDGLPRVSLSERIDKLSNDIAFQGKRIDQIMQFFTK
jgi:hypothetical protein